MTRRLLGRITRRPGNRPLATTPDDVAAMVVAAEDRKLGVEKLLDAAEHGWQAAPSSAAAARAAARAVWPRLVVKRSWMPGRWWWEVIAPDGRTLAPLREVLGYDDVDPCLPSQQAALELGLANLAVHTASWAIDELGAELPPGWERITP